METERRVVLQGKMNKDVDERLLPNGQYLHAENFQTSQNAGGEMGVGKSVAGNIRLTNLDLINAKTIGVLEDGSNDKIYYFVTSDEKDMVLEFDYNSKRLNTLLSSNRSNGVLNFNKNFLITGINKFVNGESEKDLLAWTDDINPPRIINIERAKTYPIDGFVEQDISVIKRPPLYAPVASLTYTSTGLENNLKEKYPMFAYRYRYLDGEYSALSPFTEITFSQSEFELDYNTLENVGMVNAFNAVNLGFSTGSKRVTDVQLVFKESNNPTLNVIETFNKAKLGWESDVTRSYLFSNNKICAVLPEAELYRAYDKVPLLAKAQESVGNRLVYGNYLEDYDMITADGDPVLLDYELSLVSLDIKGINLLLSVSDGASSGSRLTFNFANIALKQGTLLRLNVGMKETLYNTDGNYKLVNSFILNSDVKSATELALNTEFIAFVEQVMTSSFVNGFSMTAPANSTRTGSANFSIHSSTATTITINAPTLLFKIDDTPDNDEDDVFHNEISTWRFASETSSASFVANGIASSLKTNRSYEIGMIYKDGDARGSTVQSSISNTLYVPQKFSTFKNKLRVDLKHEPPAWAKHYSFAIKQNKLNYDTIYVTTFYEEGLDRWVLLDGANKDKVKQGDTLILKSDLDGFTAEEKKVSVIEVAIKEQNFLSENEDVYGNEIIERAGLYMRIRPNGFNMDYSESTFLNWTAYKASKSTKPTIYIGNMSRLDVATNTVVDYAVTQGSRIEIDLRNYESDGDEFSYKKSFIAQGDYANMQLWFEAEVNTLGSFTNYSWMRNENGLLLRVEARLSGATFERSKFQAKINIRVSAGMVIFETEAKDVDTQIFYETSQTFDIDSGFHKGNIQNQNASQNAIVELDSYNCFAQGNGAESFKIKDVMNNNFLNFDLRPSTTSAEAYKSVRRFADLTYGAPYVESSNFNGLNEFNPFNVNYKDDIEKHYGTIQKLYTRDTDLVVFQEDKVHKVLFGKNLLYNADGSTNLTSVDDVLNNHIAYAGEYGISRNPESLSFNGNSVFFTDAKRGCVLRLSLNGLDEVSSFGMRAWFKGLFRNSIDKKKVGAYDPYNDVYTLSSEDAAVRNLGASLDCSLTFDDSPEVKGWTTFLTFVPDMMVGMNNRFFSFKNGNLFEHHIGKRNEFYGEYSPTKVVVVFNEASNDDKIFKTLCLESNQSWDVKINTNYTDSTISSSEFKRRESRWFAYTRRSEDDVDFTSISTTGLGNCMDILDETISLSTVDGNVNIGDRLHQIVDNLQVNIGVITAKTNTTLTVAVENQPLVGAFCFSTKNARIESSSIRGYFMKAELSNSESKDVELFAVSSNTVKSYV